MLLQLLVKTYQLKKKTQNNLPTSYLNLLFAIISYHSLFWKVLNFFLPEQNFLF